MDVSDNLSMPRQPLNVHEFMNPNSEISAKKSSKSEEQYPLKERVSLSKRENEPLKILGRKSLSGKENRVSLPNLAANHNITPKTETKQTSIISSIKAFIFGNEEQKLNNLLKNERQIKSQLEEMLVEIRFIDSKVNEISNIKQKIEKIESKLNKSLPHMRRDERKKYNQELPGLTQKLKNLNNELIKLELFTKDKNLISNISKKQILINTKLQELEKVRKQMNESPAKEDYLKREQEKLNEKILKSIPRQEPIQEPEEDN